MKEKIIVVLELEYSNIVQEVIHSMGSRGIAKLSYFIEQLHLLMQKFSNENRFFTYTQIHQLFSLAELRYASLTDFSEYKKNKDDIFLSEEVLAIIFEDKTREYDYIFTNEQISILRKNLETRINNCGKIFIIYEGLQNACYVALKIKLILGDEEFYGKQSRQFILLFDKYGREYTHELPANVIPSLMHLEIALTTEPWENNSSIRKERVA